MPGRKNRPVPIPGLSLSLLLRRLQKGGLFNGLVLLTLLPCCGPAEIKGDYFQQGFDYTHLGYTALPPSDPLNKTLVIKNLKVISVGREDRTGPTSMHPHDHTAQPMQPRHEIRIVGKQLKGKIILNQVVLGNTLKYLMHNIDPTVMCPCRREDFEACVAVHPPGRCGPKPEPSGKE